MGKRAGSQPRDEQTEREPIERDFAKLRRKQTGRGGLLNFVRCFWYTLELKTRPIVEGWVLEAICMHLEARASIGCYLGFYHNRCPHSSLDGITPDQP